MKLRRQCGSFLASASVTALVVAALTGAAPARAENENITEAGDVIQLLLPISGWLTAWAKGDKEGVNQLTKAAVSAGLAARIFKDTAERRRPDATDTASFPSGHTTASYVGAEFIRQRYGNKWGIPAHIAAGFVGYSRVQANKHFADDVLAGASNGMLWNWLFTSSEDSGLNVQPVAYEDGFGFHVNYMLDGRTLPQPATAQKPKTRFTLEWGPVSQDRNLFASPVDTGTLIDLATAEKSIDFTSRITIDVFFADRHEWQVYLAPMELIEFDPAEVLTEPGFFAGVSFFPTPGTNFSARYDFGELRFSYRYTAIQSPRWTIKAGGGIQLTTTLLEVKQFLGAPADEVVVAQALADEVRANPVLSASAALSFADRWSLIFDLNASAGNDKYVNSGIFLEFQATPEWRFGFGGRYLSRDFESSKLRNELRIADTLFRVAHSFY